jgi:cyclic pyranopterin monophosphate synthase
MNSRPSLTHLQADGTAAMVDVSRKPVQKRVAVAEGLIRLQPATIEKINQSTIAKGNVLVVARVAAIGAVKRTDELIPLCHSLPVQHVRVDFEEQPSSRWNERRKITCVLSGCSGTWAITSFLT